MKKNMRKVIFIVFVLVISSGSFAATETDSKKTFDIKKLNKIISSSGVVPVSQKPQESPEELPKIALVEPYKTEVLVDSYSNSERKRAFSDSLKLIIEMSKDPNVVNYPNVKAALGKPNRYIKKFKYINRVINKDKKALFLQIDINSKALNKLLQPASKVVWVDKKPAVLFWLAKEIKGAKILTGESVDHFTNDLLMTKSKELGLNVILPMLDLNDLREIKASDICMLNTDVIKAASARYGVSVITMGCVRPGPSGTYSGHWLLMQGDKEEHFVFAGSSVENIITQALQTIANHVTKVARPVVAKDNRFVLRVMNVNSLDQYNEIVKHLHSLDKDIKRVELVNINDANIELAVSVSGDRKAFLDIIEKQKMQKLVPNMSEIALPPEIDLGYIWVGGKLEKKIINEKP